MLKMLMYLEVGILAFWMMVKVWTLVSHTHTLTTTSFNFIYLMIHFYFDALKTSVLMLRNLETQKSECQTIISDEMVSV